MEQTTVPALKIYSSLPSVSSAYSTTSSSSNSSVRSSPLSWSVSAGLIGALNLLALNDPYGVEGSMRREGPSGVGVMDLNRLSAPVTDADRCIGTTLG